MTVQVLSWLVTLLLVDLPVWLLVWRWRRARVRRRALRLLVGSYGYLPGRVL